MVYKRQRILESPCGIGRVFKNGLPVAEVQYRLVVAQEFQGMEETPTLMDILGRVTVIEGARNFTDGSTLTLELEDGRQCRFIPQHGNPSTGAYEFRHGSI